jgi:ribulose-phosphate 3-epimerase
MHNLPRIVPALIPQSLEYVARTLTELESFSRAVQIDVVDGRFVSYQSWPYVPHGKIHELHTYIQGFDVEIDLMVQEPERVIEAYLEIGIHHIVVHLESVRDFKYLLNIKSRHSFQLGFSISNDTPIAPFKEMLRHADYVQLMGIAHIGVQGQPFDTHVFTRIAEIQSLQPGLQISIDGSINTDTIQALHDAGVYRFVAGSAILNAPDKKQAFEALCALISK